MNRRDFIRMLMMGASAELVDWDKVLWIPKTIITVPEMPWIYKPSLTTSQIIAIEMERVLPKIKEMFERDDYFYMRINK